MDRTVVAFSDTYFPSINGVTYTIDSWRHEWERRGGRMDVVFPRKGGYDPSSGEHPVRSLPFPFYEQFQFGLPLVPDDLPDADLVHLHGQFMMGLAGLRYARSNDLPAVASHHMFGGHYADYLAPVSQAEPIIQRATRAYERSVYNRVDAVLVPSDATKRQLVAEVNPETDVEVVTNGVDTEFFRQTDPGPFLDRHGIDAEGPIVGYTGRHGYEKRIFDLLDAAAEMDVTLLIGGEGPAHEELRSRASKRAVDAHFLGFLDREELPAFYSALDVFAFPSPVETQGLVALEAYACGTPVVGVDRRALSDTVEDGVTGYHYEPGDIDGFRSAITRALEERDRLSENCLEKRDEVSVDASVDRLTEVYRQVL